MRSGGRKKKTFQSTCRGQLDNFPSAHFLQLFYLLDRGLEPLGIIRRLAEHLVIAGLGKLFG